jgi:tetratricopeptide (TPR) repeat protein
MKAWNFISIIFVIVLSGCQPICQKMEPVIQCPLPGAQVAQLPSAFPSLSCLEKEQAWGKELLMGNVFAKEADYYRAITCYKRALILLPAEAHERQLQLDYYLILSYYLGSKYQEALNIFQSGDLSQANPAFPAFNHLLLIAYDCYLQTEQEEKAQILLELIQKLSPETGEDLLLYQTFCEGEEENTRSVIAQHSKSEEIEKDFAFYEQFKKSPKKARTLNAILPGAGYYYVGQRKSALTSFIINALFAAASYEFFHHGYPAAGIITLSLEFGWYVGGINGAGIAANEFNTRLYEDIGKKILMEKRCFPVLLFETSF